MEHVLELKLEITMPTWNIFDAKGEQIKGTVNPIMRLL